MNIHEINNALSYIKADDRDIWLKIGSALKTQLGESGFEIFNKWSQTAPNYDKKNIIPTWKSIKPNIITIATLVHIAKQNGYISIHNSSNKTFEKIQQQENPIDKAKYIWKVSTQINNNQHKYLKTKQITNTNVLNSIKLNTYNNNNNLVIPIYNINKEIVSLQFINEQGNKKFLKNSVIKGNFLSIGDIKDNKELILTEGFATGASIYDATSKPTIICFSANNLIEVAKTLAQNNPNINYYIAADNDLSGTGFQKAKKALEHLPNAKILLPEFTQDQVNQFFNKYNKNPSDFNDLLQITNKEFIAHLFNDKENSIEQDKLDEKDLLKSEKAILDILNLEQLPQYLHKKYLVTKNGAFVALDNMTTVIFEDKGNKITTAITSIDIIKDMINIAEHKNWSKIKLEGTQEFKRLAWLEAETRGIITNGFKPTKLDLDILEKIRNEKSVNNISNDIEKNIDIKESKKIYEEKLNNLNDKDKKTIKIYENHINNIYKSLPKEIVQKRINTYYKNLATYIEGDKLNLPKEINELIEKIAEKQINL